MVREILHFPDPRLQQQSKPVEGFDAKLEELIDDLFETGWRAPGLGVAAPQIGVLLSLAVVDLSVGKDPDAKLVLANPEIVHTEGKVVLEEGCLSFPGIFTTLSRPRSLVVRARDAGGEQFELEAEGLLAQAICHEVDHLNGMLLTDHLKGLKRRMFLRRINKVRVAW